MEVNIAAGTSELLCEYFNLAINNILYSRAIYPDSEFKKVQKYDMHFYVTTNRSLKNYLNVTLNELRIWIKDDKAKDVILEVKNVRTGEALEQWMFHIRTEGQDMKVKRKIPSRVVNSQMKGILLQINNFNNMLPELEELCEIAVFVNVDEDAETCHEKNWGNGGLSEIKNHEEVNLKGFSTGTHAMSGGVIFKKRDMYDELF